jgi:hypothetical protein
MFIKSEINFSSSEIDKLSGVLPKFNKPGTHCGEEADLDKHSLASCFCSGVAFECTNAANIP